MILSCDSDSGSDWNNFFAIFMLGFCTWKYPPFPTLSSRKTKRNGDLWEIRTTIE